MYLRHGAYYHVADGRWTRLGPASDYGLALKAYADIEGRCRSARTVGELVAAYLAAAKIAPATAQAYAKSARRLEILGDILAGELDRPTVYRYVADRGTVSANRDRALLSAAYTWGQNTGLVSHNPALGLQFRAPEKARTRYLTDAEMAAVCNASHPRFAQLVLFAWLSGARQADCCSVQIGDASEAGIRVAGAKTGRPVLIGWTPTLEAVYRAAAGDRTAGPLFLNQRGKAWTGTAVRQAWDEARRRAGVADARFHDLRRKAGSEVSLDHAQALLGHTDARVTVRHYRAKQKAVRAAR
jgi:integrase